MPTEQYPNGLNALEERLHDVSLTAVGIFDDKQKRELYKQFLKSYTGHPITGSGRKTLTRENSRGKFRYDYPVMSGTTVSGSHLLHLRESHSKLPKGAREADRYLLVTADFGTNDITEWGAVSSEYSKDSVLLTLVPYGTEAKEFTKPEPNPSDSVLGSIRVKRIMETISRNRKANEIQFEIGIGGPARLSWGNFRYPETFVSLDTLHYDLVVLAESVKYGLIDNPPSGIDALAKELQLR